MTLDKLQAFMRKHEIDHVEITHYPGVDAPYYHVSLGIWEFSDDTISAAMDGAMDEYKENT